MGDFSISQETFDSLEEGWSALLPGSPNNTVFATPTWQRLWWDEFGADHELMLFSFRRGGQLEAVVPLMTKDGHLSFVGSADVCDYMDVIVRQGSEKEVYTSLADHVMALDWKILSLSGISAHSPTFRLLPDLLRDQGLSVEVRAEDVCPKVILPATWDDYLSSLRKKDRHELRRKMRRLYNTGDARYHVVQNSAAFSRELEEFLVLLVNSRADKAQFMTSERRDFFHSALSRMAEGGCVRLLFLELDGVRVSSAVCFDYNDSFLLYNSGYDNNYASLSVGLLLKAFCLKEAIAVGRKQFDFLRGSEAYKYHLGAKDEPVYRISASR
ncbi:MAG: GNAT family N-acetyltransferase [Dehalococcoidia bacterium]